ncbi:MAG TPA: hypothetical protein DCZ43_10500, partial [candidate division Zixibacteria bacterium]|nr:hypothetical protein [candidate division Zixibacteria bacterium]
MIRTIFLWLLMPGIVLAADPKIQSLINNGEYESAFDILQESADTSQGNEEMLYLLGVTAPAGKNCSIYLKEYIQKFPQGT